MPGGAAADVAEASHMLAGMRATAGVQLLQWAMSNWGPPVKAWQVMCLVDYALAMQLEGIIASSWCL